MRRERNKVVITVLGKDRVGIVAGISRTLAEHNVNILDLASTKMEEIFVMTVLADLSEADVDIAGLREELYREAKRINVEAMVHHYDVFKAMQRV